MLVNRSGRLWRGAAPGAKKQRYTPGHNNHSTRRERASWGAAAERESYCFMARRLDRHAQESAAGRVVLTIKQGFGLELVCLPSMFILQVMP